MWGEKIPAEAMMVGIVSLRQQIERLREVVLARDPAIHGGREFNARLTVRIEGLCETAWEMESLARSRGTGEVSGDALTPDLVRLANNLLDELIAVRVAAQEKSTSVDAEDRLAQLRVTERAKSAETLREHALSLLQDSRRHGNDLEKELSSISAEHHATRAELSELSGRVIQGERLLGTAQQQADQAKRTADALLGISGSIPFQLGYLVTSTVKYPQRLLLAPAAILRLMREALQRLRARRTGIDRSPLDVVGVALPYEWKESVDAAVSRAHLSTSQMAVALTGRQGQRRFSSERPETLASTRIAIIADEFTRKDLRRLCSFLPLKRATWRKAIAEFRPHLLLVESAWRGNDGEWTKHVETASPEFKALITYCGEHHIPTMFWNKEDPVHFDLFLPAAALFDYVATTDLDSVVSYAEALKHDRIFLMPFGVDPTTRNPIESGTRRNACSFAGSFYPKYTARNAAFDAISRTVQDYVPLDIYDRNGSSTQAAEFAYPAEYEPLIVGSLPHDSIDVAYKGYKYGITLNTSPSSQSMAARRVFDLLASNTIAISNYSRAIRMLFGDLVICSDDPEQIAKQWEALHADPATLDQVRLTALRKVLSEHTVEHRLAHALQVIFGPVFALRTPDIAVVAFADSQDDYDSHLVNFARQDFLHSHLKIVLAADFTPARAPLPPRVEIFSSAQARSEPLLRSLDADYVACFAPQDYYGRNYLTDLALGTKYAPEHCLGKDAFFRWDQGLKAPDDDACSYRRVESLHLRRALMPASELDHSTIFQLAIGIGTAVHHGASCVALDRFSYCEDGAGQDVEAVDGTPDIECGLDAGEFPAAARRIATRQGSRDDDTGITGVAALQEMFPRASHAHGKVTVTHAAGVFVTSELDQDAWTYVYALKRFRLKHVAHNGVLRFALKATGKISARVAVIFYDGENQRVESLQLALNAEHRIQVPQGAHSMRVAVRVAGPGRLVMDSLNLGKPRRRTSRREVLERSDRLLIGKGYPSTSRLYHYSFIHRRVLAYRQDGLKHAVMRWSQDGIAFDEFEGVEVISGSSDHLCALLQQNRFRSIEVHPLYPEMWEVLRDHLSSAPINVWVHGAEIQPWYRRPYNYPEGPLRKRAVRATQVRTAMWREIFQLRHPNLHLVFVSRYLARQSMADVGVDLAPEQYSIIHNYIDASVFDYVEKGAEQRAKILSIRPYNSPVYANDLSVKAVLALSTEPFFSSLQFLFIGDGALFESTLQPLRCFPNVEIRQGFLSQRQIAELHKQFGIFLVPTRMDSQGVSRDEAMSSGLVPVTNAVAAVPEFVDSSVAVLAPAEDWQALADGIREMYEIPELFLARSKGAARRVQAQSGYQATIAREISLIRASAADDPGHVETLATAKPSVVETRLAVYGDLNLNITDGSAVWAVSLVQVLAGLPSCEVTVFLKAPITTLHIIEPLLSLDNVRLVEPAAEQGSILSISSALEAIAEADKSLPFDAVVLRGFDLCTAATRYQQLRDRLWVYMTDLPQDPAFISADNRERIEGIIGHARRVLCQTRQFEQHMLECFPLASGKTALLPPMIPPASPHRIREPRHAPRMVYAGKFAPLWGIAEMFEVFGRLRGAYPDFELHVFGDKIHHVPEDPDFRPRVAEMLANTPGIVWHREVSREYLFAELPTFDFGWAWRQAALEDGTHELSTKVLEYAACGLPTILYPNEVNKEVLGPDYQLFAGNTGEAEAVIDAILRDKSRLPAIGDELQAIACRFEFASVRSEYLDPLVQELSAEKDSRDPGLSRSS